MPETNHDVLRGEGENPALQRLDVLRKKVRLAGAITNERFGTPNPRLRAELLYDMLARPDVVSDDHDIDIDRFADRRSILEAELLRPDAGLDRSEFISFMLGLLRSPEINRGSMTPGFEQVLAAFAAKGPLTIWTQGDVFDAPPRGDGTVEGRGEQLWKLRGGGIAVLRRELARSALGEISPGNLRSVLDVIAVGDKFDPSAIDRLAERVSGSDHVIIAEDRLDHIQRLKGILGMRGMRDVSGFWVSSGQEEPPSGVVKVGAVTEIPSLIDGMKGKIASIIDFDDVLSNQNGRIELTTKAVERYLRDADALKEE